MIIGVSEIRSPHLLLSLSDSRIVKYRLGMLLSAARGIHIDLKLRALIPEACSPPSSSFIPC